MLLGAHVVYHARRALVEENVKENVKRLAESAIVAEVSPWISSLLVQNG